MTDETAQVDSLIRQRGRIKARLTNLEKVLNKFDSNPNANFELLDLEARQAKHLPLLDEANEINIQLQSLNNDKEFLKTCDSEYESIENRYYALNGRMKQLIKQNSNIQENSQLNQTWFESIIEETDKINHIPLNNQAAQSNNMPRSVPLSSSPRDDIPDVQASGSMPTTQNKRNYFPNFEKNQIFNQTFHDPNLPKLSLPIFLGSFDAWLGFRDSFNSMVHNNSRLPDIFKFHYLKSCVKDEAAEVIASLETSNENYSVAWNLLTKRYDNQKFIVENHIEAFDLMIIHLIKKKLNFNRERWEEFSGISDFKSLENMFTFLERRALIEGTRNMLNPPNLNRPNNTKGIFITSGPNSQRPFVASISDTSTKNSQSSQKSRVCPICNSEHAIYACNNFLKLSPHDRQAQAKRASLCLNCLRSGHRVDECRLTSCRKCKGRHNTLLHFNSKSKESKQQVPSETPATTSTQNSPPFNCNIHVPS